MSSVDPEARSAPPRSGSSSAARGPPSAGSPAGAPGGLAEGAFAIASVLAPFFTLHLPVEESES